MIYIKNTISDITMSATQENLVIGSQEGRVLTLSLNRPQALNALNTALLIELSGLLQAADANADIGVVVITGNQKAFAAGADVKEMATMNAIDLHRDPRVQAWTDIARFSKPMIAAVNGFCLGGGCELAMCADYIIAGHKAVFGQPEVKLGIMPGAGGTQRLMRLVGPAKAKQMALTGATINAKQAAQAGLVAEVVAAEAVLEKAQAQAQQIASYAPIAVAAIKDCCNKALDMELQQGLSYERRSYCIVSSSEDRNEGIDAFLNKRKPAYNNR